MAQIERDFFIATNYQSRISILDFVCRLVDSGTVPPTKSNMKAFLVGKVKKKKIIISPSVEKCVGLLS